MNFNFNCHNWRNITKSNARHEENKISNHKNNIYSTMQVWKVFFLRTKEGSLDTNQTMHSRVVKKKSMNHDK